MVPDGSGPAAAQAMIAAATRSTGTTSVTPSGIPGNSFSSPLAYEMMIGSAIRKPLIHPGRGSARADSMIEGRTTVVGTSGCRVTRTRSPSALVKA